MPAAVEQHVELDRLLHQDMRGDEPRRGRAGGEEAEEDGSSMVTRSARRCCSPTNLADGARTPQARWYWYVGWGWAVRATARRWREKGDEGLVDAGAGSTEVGERGDVGRPVLIFR